MGVGVASGDACPWRGLPMPCSIGVKGGAGAIGRSKVPNEIIEDAKDTASVML